MFEFALNCLKWKFGRFLQESKYILSKKMRTMKYWCLLLVFKNEMHQKIRFNWIFTQCLLGTLKYTIEIAMHELSTDLEHFKGLNKYLKIKKEMINSLYRIYY